MRNTL
jgi:dynein heavy chain